MYIPVNPSQQIQNFKFVAMDLELMGGALYLKPFTRVHFRLQPLVVGASFYQLPRKKLILGIVLVGAWWVRWVFWGHIYRDRFWYKSYINLSILIPT